MLSQGREGGWMGEYGMEWDGDMTEDDAWDGEMLLDDRTGSLHKTKTLATRLHKCTTA